MGRHSSPPFVYLAASYLRYCLQCDSGHKVFDDVGGRVTTLMEDSTEASSLFSAVVAGRLAICTPWVRPTVGCLRHWLTLVSKAITTLMEDSEPSSVQCGRRPCSVAPESSPLQRRREPGRPYSAGMSSHGPTTQQGCRQGCSRTDPGRG
ncbi:hypothetical protein LZ32DRAFT_253145 [Colletotrichum eremochloae]|nr:hypothetical protein LZ32DRAFT_253145 [Colletotrichum eremochloae]